MKFNWKSKTVWFNALSIVATYAGFVPLDPKVVTYVVLGANIGLRALTKGPLFVANDAATEP